MRSPILPLAALLGALSASGCNAKLESSITLDGKPFQPTSCRSGQAFGFAGVELADASGMRVRLVSLPSGQSQAHLFAAGAATSTELGDCGPMTVNRQSSSINNIQNVEGKATLSCGRLTGSTAFSNCH